MNELQAVDRALVQVADRCREIRDRETMATDGQIAANDCVEAIERYRIELRQWVKEWLGRSMDELTI